ncbi:MAG TPA: AbrB/MazE/SpoVT family DNA-binding domain-containing protein [Candidatus Diapherotrites archaeon]|uniref:AbrB/MazE/SpoVT family DNA-binding domain-containing protein n=1 Tax=Candidatus Iainarchaeum sp. TaxID=3101447 RepID=A0A7J4IY70_9ARCH|nr:AbrB/MazE/SpoVT family DNA-binding domain-containing protein [Candidatus Diapherotrites archaeon]
MAVTVTTKKWGNSVGLVIPKEVVERQGIKPEQKVEIEVRPVRHPFAKFFGSLKTGRPVQEIKDELRKELWGKEL